MLKPVFSFLFLALLAVPTARAEKLHVAVAANFTAPAKELAEMFQQRSGHEAVLSFGSSGKLYAQIRHGAPYQVFLAADEARPLRTIEDGLAEPDSRFTYAIGQLVLWSPKESTPKALWQMLKEGRFRRIAIANPKTAPYGQAALEVLQQFAPDAATSGRLVYGENIAQTHQFTASGNVDLGLIAASQVIGQAQPGWRVPAGWHRPIRQQAVLLKRARNNPAATDFLSFLKGSEARAVIHRYGYGTGEN